MSDPEAPRIENPKIFWLVVALLILLFAGIINYLVEGATIPPSIPIVRSLRAQTLIETVLYIVFITMGFLGVFSMYKFFTARHPSKSYLIGGLVLYAIFLAAIILLGSVKGLPVPTP